MTKTVVIVGALDTKGAEFALVKDLIEKQGLKTLSYGRAWLAGGLDAVRRCQWYCCRNGLGGLASG